MASHAFRRREPGSFSGAPCNIKLPLQKWHLARTADWFLQPATTEPYGYGT